jgi:hypothetical protein
MNWISVKDFLPPYGENVIIWLEERESIVGFMHVGRFEKGNWILHKDNIEFYDMCEVTHWMRIYEPKDRRHGYGDT